MNQDLNEALLIAEGKTMLLPARRHLIALANELQRFDKYIEDYEEYLKKYSNNPVFKQFT